MSANSRHIYKIEDAAVWAQAMASGVYTGAPVDAADGFIHFSTAAQVQETAAKHFAGRANLVLIAVDGRVLGAALKWEPSRGGALFPHLFAPLRANQVLSVVALPLAADGIHVFPMLLT